MKEVETQIQRNIIYWEAVDGTHFDSKEECAEYEKTAGCVIKAKFKNLKKQEFSSEKIALGMYDGTAYIIKFEESSDIDIVARYIAYMNNTKLSDSTINKLMQAYKEHKHILVLASCDDDCVWVECILEDHIDMLKSLI